MDNAKLPSRYQHGDYVTVSFADAGTIKNCQVDSVIFDIGKIYYNLTVKMTIDDQTYFTNLLQVDSAFISSQDASPEYKAEMRKR